MIKIGILTSGKDDRSYDMINKVLKEKKKDLNVDIKFIFSNIEEGERKSLDKIFKLTKNNQIEKIVFSSSGFERNLRMNDPELWAHKFDKKISYYLDPYDIDILVLAGYEIDPSDFLKNKFNLVNIHPAPPKGPEGTIDDVIEQMIKTKNRIGGVMSHTLTTRDDNQAIMYASFLISDITNSDKIKKQIAKREPEVLYYTLKAFSEGLIEMKNHKIFLKDEYLFDPISLTGNVK